MKKIFCLLVVLMFSTVAIFSQSYSGGNGNSDNPYLILTKADLKYLSEHTGEWGKYFKQTADIIFSDADFQSGGDFYNGGSGFIPIGGDFSTRFEGGYDGNGHKISNLKINRASAYSVGLFGFVYSGVEIKNLGVENVNITGGSQVGGLAGYAENVTISNCYTTGSLSSTNNTGGIVGYDPSCTISNCYSTCSVSGTNDVGGFVGYNNGTISNCYSTGLIGGGSTNPGGFAGINWEIISNCFWDTQTSGTSIGIYSGSSTTGVTGKTTSEMKTNTTFLNAGWDYNIWFMDSGVNNGYPYLSWQNPGGTPLPVELSTFSASVSSGTVTLKWQTATEVNNLGFDIERSSLNNTFNKIGFVPCSGNSNSPKNYSFTDEPSGGISFYYRLKQIDTDGKYEYSNIIEVDITPNNYWLSQNYPNPFNPSTKIKYAVPQTSAVILKVFDILGNEIETLVNEEKTVGDYEVEFDASNIPSGVYVYQLRTADFIQTKKMILVK